MVCLVAVVIHLAAAIITARLVPLIPRPLRTTAFRVDLVTPEPAPETPPTPRPVPESEPEARAPKKHPKKRPRPRPTPPPVSDAVEAAPPELATPTTEVPTDEPPETPETNVEPNLDLDSSRHIFAKVASEDPRIRRMLDKPEEGPFAKKKGPSKFNLPRDLPFDEIRRVVDQAWNPEWDQIKDKAVSEYSGKRVKQGLKEWFQSWQEEVKKQSGKHAVPKDAIEEIIAVPDKTYTASRVSVEIDLEPLRDGSYAASIATPSGHPFFDAAALQEIKQMAAHLPPWKEGYGNALRYKLEAQFIIIPPRPDTLIGLSCAFPFCHPDELKELELMHWFKKIIVKNVYFQGMIAPPPLPDEDGQDGDGTDGDGPHGPEGPNERTTD